jgi:hypothetical protein
MMLAVIAATVVAMSCKKEEDENPANGSKFIYAAEVQAGNGKARSFLNQTIITILKQWA